jgi:magnesium transporter
MIDQAEHPEQPTIPEELRELIENRNWHELARRRGAWPEPEIAAPEVGDLLMEAEKRDRVLLFRALPRDLSADVLSWLDTEIADRLLLELSDPETRSVLAELDPDDRAALVDELPATATKRLMGLLSPGDRAEVRVILGYPEESVGRLMNPDYVAVRPSWTMSRVFEEVRAVGPESATVSVIYVTDERGVLIDALPLERFVVADIGTSVREIMDDIYVYVSAYDDREEAVRIMGRYDQVALPVVDSANVLIGIVTVDDVMDVAEAEVTEDFQLGAAVQPLKGGYWDLGPFQVLRSRIVWLVGLVFVNLISAAVLSAFEDVLASYVTLTFFIPLVIAAGGNSGIQSATMIIRAISTGEIELRQWLKVLLKEAIVGIGIGVLLGALGLVLGMVIGSGPGIGLQVGGVVACTLVSVIVATNIFSVILPFLLTVLNLDPAMASGPFITSVVDVMGLLIYFGWSSVFLFA